jgi:hypothetical protein
MGKHLQIRVQAVTWPPEAVEKVWPALYELAWPQGTPTVPGVFDLVQTLDDQRRFGAWSPERKDALGRGLEDAVRLKVQLEQALANWKPSEANTLSDQLEETLGTLERAARD